MQNMKAVYDRLSCISSIVSVFIPTHAVEVEARDDSLPKIYAMQMTCDLWLTHNLNLWWV